MRFIIYPWNTEKKLNDIIRIEMNSTFFPYFNDKIIPVPDGVTNGFSAPGGAVESCHQVLLT